MNFTPLRIAVIYFIFAMAWILFTDRLLIFFAEDIYSLSLFQTGKGFFYISLTTGILYLMVRSYERFIKSEQSEKEVKERSFNMALNSVQMATWEFFVQSNSYITSPNHNKLFGIDEYRDITLQNVYDRIYEEDLSRFKKAVEKTLSDYTDFNIEYRVKLPDGAIRWLWTKGKLFYGSSGEERVSGVTIDITDKKNLEKRLELEKEKLEKLFGMIPILITIYDPSLTVISVNRQFENILGWTKADLKTKDIMKLCYPNSSYRKKVSDFMIKPDSGWKELEVMSKDGRVHHQLWTNITLADDTFVGIGHDITEQKLKEQDLREKEYLLSESQRVASLGTYIIKPATGEEKPSEILSRIFGAPEGEEITLEQWAKSVHPDYKHIIKEFDDAVEKGLSFVQEYKLIRESDGAIRWIYEKAEHIFDASGKSEAMIGTAQDITERKKQEKLFERQRDQLLKAQEIAQLGYWVLRLKDWSFEWSDMTFNLFGRNFEGGEPGYKEFLKTIVHPDDKKDVEDSFKECLLKGSEEIVYRAVKPDNEVIFIQGNAELVLDKDGNGQAIRGTFLDITRLKKIEDELKEEQKRFEIAANISSDVVWEWSIGAEELWWGEGIETVFGYKKEDYSGVTKFWQSKIHPEDKERVINRMEEAENSDALEWNDEYRFLAADGSIKQVKDSAVIRRDEEGNVIRIIGAMVDVTTIVRYQQVLQRERQRFEMIAKSSNDVLYEWNMNTNEVWWSEGWQSNFGFKENEVKNDLEWWEDKIHPDDQERVSKSLKLAKKTGENSWNEQYRFLNADNEYSILLDRAFFIKDDTGQNKYMTGTISDITAQVEAEKKLKASEEQYRLLFEQSPIPMWIFDKETLHFITANNAAVEKYGYSKRELNNMTIFDLHIEEDLAEIKKEAEANLKVPKTGFDAWTHQTKEGEKLIVEISGSDIFYRGKICRLILANDVTEKKLAEEKLKASEEQYRLLFEQNPIPMWIYDPDTYAFIEVNEATQKKYGYSCKQFLKMSILDIRPQNDIEKVKKDIVESRGKDEPTFGEWTHITSSGKEMKVEISGSDIFYKGKRQRLIIANDITEQRKAEKRAISAIIEGEERERKRISKELHDGLGQYLSAANMNLETVYEDMPALDKNLASSFKNGLKFLGHAISETRTISQNLLPKAIQDYGLELAIESLVTQLKNTNKDIKFYLYRNLNGAEIPDKIQINLYRIAQEALNNAIRHAEPKNVDVQLVYSENEILMSIEDNGIGFEKDKVSEKGIGLRSMETRVGAMSANLDIVSTKGRGTIISIVIPLLKET